MVGRIFNVTMPLRPPTTWEPYVEAARVAFGLVPGKDPVPLGQERIGRTHIAVDADDHSFVIVEDPLSNVVRFWFKGKATEVGSTAERLRSKLLRHVHPPAGLCLDTRAFEIGTASPETCVEVKLGAPPMRGRAAP